MTLPNFLQSALWSYNIKILDPEKDQKYIISQILNHGNWKQLKWLLRSYPLSNIKNVLLNPGQGVWFEDVFNYWLTLLNLKLPRNKKEKALFNLELK